MPRTLPRLKKPSENRELVLGPGRYYRRRERQRDAGRRAMFCLVSQPAAEKNSGETAEMPAEKNGGETAELMDRGLGSRPLARCALGICLVALAVWPASAQGRVDLFDRQGRRQGSAVIDQESGRVDFYDALRSSGAVRPIGQEAGRPPGAIRGGAGEGRRPVRPLAAITLRIYGDRQKTV